MITTPITVTVTVVVMMMVVMTVVTVMVTVDFRSQQVCTLTLWTAVAALVSTRREDETLQLLLPGLLRAAAVPTLLTLSLLAMR
eukprot:COSAG06_NODE_762_length_12488_cov_36.564614_2_plen_84_part_00